MLPSHATLVVVPSHLLKQWELEFTKFFGPKTKLKLVVIYSVDDIPTAGVLQACDVVVVSQRLFMAERYKEFLGMKPHDGHSALRDEAYLQRVDQLRTHATSTG